MRFIFFLSALISPIISFGEVRICATNEQIQSFCNTRKVKTVFIFNKKIHFIDFSEENPKVSAIAATGGAIMPVISPDGALVAYNSGILYDPPANGSASIYVCPLDENAQPTRKLTRDLCHALIIQPMSRFSSIQHAEDPLQESHTPGMAVER